MISPTVGMFQRLATHATVDEVLAAAAAGSPARQARVADESRDLVRFEGEADFDAVDTRLALGWVWLEPGSLA